MNPTDIRSYPASRAFEWLAQGWRIVMALPKPLLLAGLVSFVILVLLGFIPKVGQLLSAYATLFLLGGLIVMAKEADAGRQPAVSQVFEVFRSQGGSVLGASLIMGVVITGFVILVFVLAGGSALLGRVSGSSLPKGMGASLVALIMLLGLLAIVLSVGLFWFSLPLIVLRKAKAMQSLGQSMRGFARNWGAVLLISLLFFLLSIVAAIPLGSGMILLLPVMAATTYAAVNDVYVEQGAA
jgi:uncharacterized membrane protein